MPRQINILMENNYPFGQCQQYARSNQKILVRQIIEFQSCSQSKQALVNKSTLSKKISQKGTAIEIKSILQQDQSIHLLYQYIPIKLEKWIRNIDEHFLQKIAEQLGFFAEDLAKHHIFAEMALSNIGMNQQYKTKYFLGIDFAIHEQQDQIQLKDKYYKQIGSLFYPYLQRDISVILKSGHQLFKSQADCDHLEGKASHNIKRFEEQNNRCLVTGLQQNLSDTKQLTNIIQQINKKQQEENQINFSKKAEELGQNQNFQTNTSKLRIKKQQLSEQNQKNQVFFTKKQHKLSGLNPNQSTETKQNNQKIYKMHGQNHPSRKQFVFLSIPSQKHKNPNLKLTNLLNKINELKQNIQKVSSKKKSSNIVQYLGNNKLLQKNTKFDTKFIHDQQRFKSKNFFFQQSGKNQFQNYFNKGPQKAFLSFQNAFNLTSKVAKQFFSNSNRQAKVNINERLKRKQYSQMINSDKNYFQDFASVLEDNYLDCKNDKLSSFKKLQNRQMALQLNNQPKKLKILNANQSKKSYYAKSQKKLILISSINNQKQRLKKGQANQKTQLTYSKQQQRDNKQKKLKQRISKAIKNSKSLINSFNKQHQKVY